MRTQNGWHAICSLSLSLTVVSFVSLADKCQAQGIRYVDRVHGSDDNDGTEWAEAYATFGRAVIELNANNAVSQIWIAGSSTAYRPGETATDGFDEYGWIIDAAVESGAVRIIGGFVGSTDDEQLPGERVLAVNITTLSGDIELDDDPEDPDTLDDNAIRVIDLVESERSYEIDGVRIERGNSDGEEVISGSGAGVRAVSVSGGVLTRNSRLQHNRSSFDGAGLYAFATAIELRYCRFEQNQLISDATPILGGAGLACGALIAVNSSFAGNEIAADAGGGGAVVCHGAVHLVSCDFEGNLVGIGTESGGACEGGAVLVETGLPRIENCRFFANKARDDGGAVYVKGPCHLVNCTVAGNEVEQTDACGGVRTVASLLGGPTVQNCILWSNTDGSSMSFEQQLTVTPIDSTVEYSCVQGIDLGMNGFPTSNIDEDPEFANLSSGNLRLDQESSPAKDAGNAALLPDDDADVNDDDIFNEPLPWELTKTPRVIGAEVDMGAYEGCPTDFNGDGKVDGDDLGAVLGDWGSSRLPPFSTDVNNDFRVDGDDLGEVLGNWGCSSEPEESRSFSSGPTPSAVAEILGFESVGGLSAWLGTLSQEEVIMLLSEFFEW